MRYFLLSLSTLITFNACHTDKSKEKKTPTENLIVESNIEKEETQETDSIIIDSNYTFEEAIEGTNAPKEVIDELELLNVRYISTDNKLHQGQIITNKQIAKDIKELFQLMLEQGFVIEKAISYSFHAKGRAIDINPHFNPLRWKTENRPNQPYGAVLDTTVNGTLHPKHPIVKEFKKRGFRWGHYFSKFWDDHHFDKK